MQEEYAGGVLRVERRLSEDVLCKCRNGRKIGTRKEE